MERAQAKMRLLRGLASLVSFPVIFAELFSSSTGSQYSVSLGAKIRLAWKIRRNRRRVQMGSSYYEQLLMVTRILRIPSSAKGCLVECGTWKGGSAVNLSLAAALCNRKLHIFDSFEGLPAPTAGNENYGGIGERSYVTYASGDYRGTLDEVRSNMTKYGKIENCVFHKGYFSETLPRFQEACVFAFLDVDLVESLHDCLLSLWPTLGEDCYIFTHEARDSQIASAFFDHSWWGASLGVAAPGLVGAEVVSGSHLLLEDTSATWATRSR